MLLKQSEGDGAFIDLRNEKFYKDMTICLRVNIVSFIQESPLLCYLYDGDTYHTNTLLQLPHLKSCIGRS